MQCAGNCDISDAFYGNWSTSNTSVATVNYYGVHTGVSAGSTTSTTDGEVESNNVPHYCPMQAHPPKGNDNVQKPTSDAICDQNTNGARGGCPAGYAGWDRDVDLIVLDQSGQQIIVAGQQMNEKYTIGNNGLHLTSIATGQTTTNAAGLYTDEWWFCSTYCPGSGTTTATQAVTDTYNGTPFQWSNTIVYGCGAITHNGN
jgi:hypothetical protein